MYSTNTRLLPKYSANLVQLSPIFVEKPPLNKETSKTLTVKVQVNPGLYFNLLNHIDIPLLNFFMCNIKRYWKY